VAGDFLKQMRKARQAAKMKPETRAARLANEMTEANLGAEVKPTPSRRRRFSCVLRFFRFPTL
jgi:hypothetical protein